MDPNEFHLIPMDPNKFHGIQMDSTGSQLIQRDQNETKWKIFFFAMHPNETQCNILIDPIGFQMIRIALREFRELRAIRAVNVSW